MRNEVRPARLSTGLLLFALSVLVGRVAAENPAPAQPFDVVIAHGHIVDGTGSPWYSGDVGIRDGRIAAIRGCRRRSTRASQPRSPGRAARWLR
jgi:hypothetical protein